MQYVRMKNALKGFTIFSLNDIRKIDAGFHRRRLNEWQDKGYIRKVVKEYYIFSDLKLDENRLFEIANRIYAPSYISFEMALSYHHLIPESVYGMTSASTRRTYKFKTAIAQFGYRTIKPSLFFGYDIVRYGNGCFKIAGREKAILDYFYINTGIKESKDFAGLRINRDVFLKEVNRKKLSLMLKKFAQKKLKERVESFLKFLQNKGKK